MERVVVKTRVKQGYINIFYEHLIDNQILRFNHEIPRKHWTFYIKFCDKSVNMLQKIDLKILSEMNKLQKFNNLQPRLNVMYL